jgi:hypothetical protein
MSIEVGSRYRWRSDALGIRAGTLGICYTQLGETCAGLLFETGVPSALTDAELNRYAESLGQAPDMAFYRFEDLGRLLDDFSRGRFASMFHPSVESSRVA